MNKTSLECKMNEFNGGDAKNKSDFVNIVENNLVFKVMKSEDYFYSSPKKKEQSIQSNTKQKPRTKNK